MSGKAGAIAIDGQAAAGKTAVGRELALRLGCPFLDTGIMYRAVTWLALKEGVAMEDERGLSQLASSSTMRPSDQEANGLVLNGITLATELRTAEVDQHVSLVARVSGVRQEMVRQQRDISARARQESGGIVMVGRDIGTVVLPDADLKVFMVASPQVRAQRRYDAGFRALRTPANSDILYRDPDRIPTADSPLAQRRIALLVDTSDLTIDQVVEKILERLGSPVGRTVR